MKTQFNSEFDAFVEPARERNEIWRTILGFVLIAVIFVLFVALIAATTVFICEATRIGSGFRLIFELEQGESLFATLTLLGAIGLLIPALWLVLRFLHKRPLSSVLGPNNKINWRYWGIGVAVVCASGVLQLLFSFNTMELEQQMPFQEWLIWLPLAVFLLFCQTTAEEVVFRGYLQQQLAARFQSRLIWMVLPSVVFGFLHWNPDMFGANTYFVIAVTTLVGFIAADVTARLGSLSPALGLHFANNLFVMLFINTKGQLSGASLFLHDMDLKGEEVRNAMLLSFSTMAILYGIFIVIHRRRR